VDVDQGLFRPSAEDVHVTLEVSPPGGGGGVLPVRVGGGTPDGWLRNPAATPDTRWVRRLALRLGEDGRIYRPGRVCAPTSVTDATAAAVCLRQRLTPAGATRPPAAPARPGLAGPAS